MKSLKEFIKESIEDMLTFKGGGNSESDRRAFVSNEDKVKAMEILACKQLFSGSKPGSFSYEYYYESSKYPEGIIVTCNISGKKYLASYHGYVIDLNRR